MAERIFMHIGLPKTGTTYLQTILWANRPVLRDQGVLLPGFGPRQHLWASCVVREEQHLERRHEDAHKAWAELVEQMSAWPGTALISHEFFAAASTDQVRRALADLGQTEVHVVVTAREIVGLLTARWQEWIKNGATGTIDHYPPREEIVPADAWGWASLDLADVLRRWGGGHVPHHQIHVIPLPARDQPHDELWRRFCGVVGIDADSCDTKGSRSNESLGVIEVELLRRVNPHLRDFRHPLDKGIWIRSYLAQEKLVPRGGERFLPSPARVAELRDRGEAGLDEIAAGGYDVAGDLASLRTPPDLPDRRTPEAVTDSEVAQVAVELVAQMLRDVRDLRRGQRDLRRQLAKSRRHEDPGLRVALSRRFPALRHVLLRGKHTSTKTTPTAS